MSYEPTNWKKGDKVTSTKLNKIENGIQGNDEEITALNTQLTAVTGNGIITGWIDEWFISTNRSTYDPNSAVFNSAFRYVIVECSEGDVFTINGTGGGNPRLWAFADSSNNILSNAGNDATGSNLVIVAPHNATRLIINDKTKTADSYYGELLINKVDAIKDDVDSMLTVDFAEHSGYISANGTFSTASSEYQEVYTDKIFVKNGQTIDFKIEYTSQKSMWLVYATYDKFGNFISRIPVLSANVVEYSTSITINSANVSYIAFSYRTFGVSTVSIKSNQIPSINGQIDGIKSDLTLYDYSINTNIKGINHRGYNTVAPENTLVAFKMSKQKGFKFVETDVQFTSDGVPVLLHDISINRTARNADGTELSTTVNINSITYEQALDYDFGIYKGAEYAETKIPTFTEFIDLCKNIGLHCYVELKSDVTYTSAQIEGLVDIVKQHGMFDSVTWISFSSTALGYVYAYDNTAKIGYLVSTISESAITSAQALGANVFISASSSNLSEATIALCINANIPLEVWTVNDVSTLLDLDPYISGVTSDKLNAGYEFYKANIG